MANLLHLIVDLVEDAAAREALRSDPDSILATFPDLTGEDVAAAVDVARIQVEPRLAERLTTTLAAKAGHDETPRDVAARSLLSLCDAVEEAEILAFPGAARDGRPDGPDESTGAALPDRPPGLDRPFHLWAVGDPESADGTGLAGSHPAGGSGAKPLASVPDPPGGFEFSVLELVSLPHGIPEHGIEPGAQATVVAVHRAPELSYEVEVSDVDGGRRFLGVVPTSAVGRPS